MRTSSASYSPYEFLNIAPFRRAAGEAVWAELVRDQADGAGAKKQAGRCEKRFRVAHNGLLMEPSLFVRFLLEVASLTPGSLP